MSPAMANWERAPRVPPKACQKRWPAPSIFVNVEFGVSFADERTHTASMKYTSKRMEGRLHEQRLRHQQELGIYQSQQRQIQQEQRLVEQRHERRGREDQHRSHRELLSLPAILPSSPIALPSDTSTSLSHPSPISHPTILMPAHGIHQEHQSQNLPQQRQRRLGVRTQDRNERGASAPPVLALRTAPMSPVSPMSPIGSLQHSASMPINRTNQALPPTPSQFRLGDDDMPWSMPPWYRPPEPEFASPVPVRSESEPCRLDDPQRVRDLEALHQAMMTVDSLNNGGWEPWTWNSEDDMPRGPRSIGWAVSSHDAPSRTPITPHEPPPYVVSQWERSFERGRPASSGI